MLGVPTFIDTSYWHCFRQSHTIPKHWPGLLSSQIATFNSLWVLAFAVSAACSPHPRLTQIDQGYQPCAYLLGPRIVVILDRQTMFGRFLMQSSWGVLAVTLVRASAGRGAVPRLLQIATERNQPLKTYKVACSSLGGARVMASVCAMMAGVEWTVNVVLKAENISTCKLAMRLSNQNLADLEVLCLAQFFGRLLPITCSCFPIL